MTRRITNKYKLTAPLLQKPPISKPYIPPELGKPEKRLSVRANTVDFFQACVEARGPHELKQIPPSQNPAATLLEHMQVHSVPINTKRGMTNK